ncbi:hypothetical protein ACIRPU_41915 [Streptomyces sp. NPDC102259]|uniref:hypothetical protein n=1 Tax=Streptomyces sp. NPDC102259 TaxID=3366148 RepID=UPI0037FBFC16
MCSEDKQRLETLWVWHALWLTRIDAKIAAVQPRQAVAFRRRHRVTPPGGAKGTPGVYVGRVLVTGEAYDATHRANR